jgi:hypothetical protein
MSILKHIVQIHPVKNGEPKFSVDIAEQEFDTEDEVYAFSREYNNINFYNNNSDEQRSFAFYRGKIELAKILIKG